MVDDSSSNIGQLVCNVSNFFLKNTNFNINFVHV